MTSDSALDLVLKLLPGLEADQLIKVINQSYHFWDYKQTIEPMIRGEWAKN
jgi:hypothetical protein